MNLPLLLNHHGYDRSVVTNPMLSIQIISIQPSLFRIRVPWDWLTLSCQFCLTVMFTLIQVKYWTFFMLHEKWSIYVYVMSLKVLQSQHYRLSLQFLGKRIKSMQQTKSNLISWWFSSLCSFLGWQTMTQSRMCLENEFFVFYFSS